MKLLFKSIKYLRLPYFKFIISKRMVDKPKEEKGLTVKVYQIYFRKSKQLQDLNLRRTQKNFTLLRHLKS